LIFIILELSVKVEREMLFLLLPFVYRAKSHRYVVKRLQRDASFLERDCSGFNAAARLRFWAASLSRRIQRHVPNTCSPTWIQPIRHEVSSILAHTIDVLQRIRAYKLTRPRIVISGAIVC
jgi:hypothetical protein